MNATLRDGFRVFLVNGHHRWEAMKILAAENKEETAWTRAPIEVFFTLRRDGRKLTALEITKSSQFLNTLSSSVLQPTSLFDVLESFMAYSTSFHATYKVPFTKAKISDIRRDMMNAQFISKGAGESQSKYTRYIRLARLCLLHDTVVPSVKDLKSWDPRPVNDQTVDFALFHISDARLERY